jgi:hypothetical protein
MLQPAKIERASSSRSSSRATKRWFISETTAFRLAIGLPVTVPPYLVESLVEIRVLADELADPVADGPAVEAKGVGDPEDDEEGVPPQP